MNLEGFLLSSILAVKWKVTAFFGGELIDNTKAFWTPFASLDCEILVIDACASTVLQQAVSIWTLYNNNNDDDDGDKKFYNIYLFANTDTHSISILSVLVVVQYK